MGSYIRGCQQPEALKIKSKISEDNAPIQVSSQRLLDFLHAAEHSHDRKTTMNHIRMTLSANPNDGMTSTGARILSPRGYSALGRVGSQGTETMEMGRELTAASSDKPLLSSIR